MFKKKERDPEQPVSEPVSSIVTTPRFSEFLNSEAERSKATRELRLKEEEYHDSLGKFIKVITCLT